MNTFDSLAVFIPFFFSLVGSLEKWKHEVKLYLQKRQKFYSLIHGTSFNLLSALPKAYIQQWQFFFFFLVHSPLWILCQKYRTWHNIEILPTYPQWSLILQNVLLIIKRQQWKPGFGVSHWKTRASFCFVLSDKQWQWEIYIMEKDVKFSSDS